MNTKIYRDIKIIFIFLLSVISIETVSSQNSALIYEVTFVSNQEDLDRNRENAYLQLNDDSTFIYRNLYIGRPATTDVLSKGTWISEGDTLMLSSDDRYASAPIFSQIKFDYFVRWIQFNELKLLQGEGSTLYCYPYKDAVCHLVRRIRYCSVIKARTKPVCFYEDGHPRKYSVFDENVDVQKIKWTLTPVSFDSIQNNFMNRAYQMLEPE